ncbi:hypothetical protein [Flavobacterium sp.]
MKNAALKSFFALADFTQVDGKFVVTNTQPVSLSRIYVDNFPEAPQTFSLTCNKVR